jgi:hypothetical protein
MIRQHPAHDARVLELRTATMPAATPPPTPRESMRRLRLAVVAFTRELRAWAGAWLRAHRIGFVERARAAGYVEGYCDGLAANPRRSA